MNKAPFLSIILPVYNVAQYIPRLMKSLLDPRLPHEIIEIIFVDDCSPDNSSEIIKEYMVDNENIRIIKHRKNKRVGGGRNTGLKAAKGEYVFFVDPDDEIIPEGVYMAMNHLINSPVKLDVAMFDMLSSDKNTLTYNSNSTDIMKGVEYFYRNSVAWIAPVSMYKRYFLLEKQLFSRENVMFEDVDWVLRAQALADSIQYQPYPIYFYHYNHGSICFSLPTPKSSEDRFWCAHAIAEFTNSITTKELRCILQAHCRLAYKEAVKSLCYHSYAIRADILKKIRTHESASAIRNIDGLMKYIIHYPFISNIFMEFIHILLPVHRLTKRII